MSDFGNDMPVIDYTVIKQLHSIDPQGKRNLLKRLVEMYLESAPGVIQELQNDLEKRDTEHLKLLIHRFKTTNANLGLKRMHSILNRLDTETLSVQEQKPLILQLNLELQSALKALNELQSP